MKLTIRSNGEVTIVLDENGQDITQYVYRVEWEHQSRKAAQARVTFLATALDYVGEARIHVEAVVGAESLAAKSKEDAS